MLFTWDSRPDVYVVLYYVRLFRHITKQLGELMDEIQDVRTLVILVLLPCRQTPTTEQHQPNLYQSLSSRHATCFSVFGGNVPAHPGSQDGKRWTRYVVCLTVS